MAVLNGAGELTSAIQVREWGGLETPILLTSTMQVGRAWDAVVELLAELEPAVGRDLVTIPMVGECDDSWLNDARRTQISTEDVRAAVLGATAGPVPEGAVGAGTGMICCEWKGGIGTASRVIEGPFTIGVLLLTNFGSADRLTVDGVPVGRTLRPPPEPSPDGGDAGAASASSHRPPCSRPSWNAWPAGSASAWPGRALSPAWQRRDLRRGQHGARRHASDRRRR